MMRKKKSSFVIIGIIAVIFILITWFVLQPKTDKRIQWFEDEFGLNLPKDTEIVFSQDDYGAMGDGYRLYVYQLTPNGMNTLLNYKKLGNWSALPIKDKMAKGLYEQIDGLSNSKITHAIDLNTKNGYYIIKNRYNKPLGGYDFQDESYYNVIIGIIDTKNNKIYYCTWDM